MIRKNALAVIIGIIGTLLLFGIVNRFHEKNLEHCLPVLAFQAQRGLWDVWMEEKTEVILPVFSYPEENSIVARRKDRFQLKKIKQVEILTMMEFENIGEEIVNEPIATEAPTVPLPTQQPQITPEPIVEEPAEETMANTFVPHTLQNIVDLQALSDYETLMKKFYIVDSVAMVGSDLLDADALAGMDLRITKSPEEPQILIYHTHSQEGFADSVPGDDSTTIMGVGEHLAEILRSQYGYNVLHHTGKYDVKTRDNAYSRALPEIKKILEENPSIQVVIDLHRDAVADESNKLVMDLDGRPTARFMFFNGVSCTRKTGKIDYLYNPNLAENLAFSFQMKKVAEEYYPGLTRKNYIHGYRYNMHLCKRTTLLELGAQNNTLQEAMNACDPIAHILDMVLTGA